MRNTTFNILIVGIGGQGVLTLASIIANAAIREGKDVKTSELHGLAMRFGPMEAHVRIGECYSPLTSRADADLVFGLEPLEALRALYYASPKKSVAVCDTKPLIPLLAYIEKKQYPQLAEVEKILKKQCRQALFVDASEKARAETGSTIPANVFLLGVAAGRGLLPIKKEALLKQLEDTLAGKALEQNKKLFQQGLEMK